MVYIVEALRELRNQLMYTLYIATREVTALSELSIYTGTTQETKDFFKTVG